MSAGCVSIASTASGASLTATQSTYCECRQHLGAQCRGKNRPSGSLVDETIGGNGDHKDVAELACRLQMADVAEVEKSKVPCACTTLLPVARSCACESPQFRPVRSFSRVSDDGWSVELLDHFFDVESMLQFARFCSPSLLFPRYRNQSLVASAMRDTVQTGASRQ